MDGECSTNGEIRNVCKILVLEPKREETTRKT
jgi:hypothetical protein